MERLSAPQQSTSHQDIPEPALSATSTKALCMRNTGALRAIKRLWSSHNMRAKHTRNIKFIRACDHVFDTWPDAYYNNSSKVIYAQGYLLKDVQNAWYQCQDNQGLDGITGKDFKDFLLKRLRPAAMRNANVKKRNLEAQQVPSQTVSSFIMHLNQLLLQFFLPISKPQRAGDLLHKLWPNNSQKIF